MSNKKILQGHNKALESLATIAGIKLTKGIDLSLLGITKWEVGSFTLSTSELYYRLTHSLGKIPRMIIVTSENVTNSDCINELIVLSNKARTFAGILSIYNNNGNSRDLQITGAKLTENAVNLEDGSNYFLAGKTYNYIVMA